MGGPEPVYFCICSENLSFLLRKDRYFQQYITTFLSIFFFLTKLSKIKRNFFTLENLESSRESSEINKTLESTFLFHSRQRFSVLLVNLP